jgi:hypothetical protein
VCENRSIKGRIDYYIKRYLKNIKRYKTGGFIYGSKGVIPSIVSA